MSVNQLWLLDILDQLLIFDLEITLVILGVPTLSHVCPMKYVGTLGSFMFSCLRQYCILLYIRMQKSEYTFTPTPASSRISPPQNQMKLDDFLKALRISIEVM